MFDWLIFLTITSPIWIAGWFFALAHAAHLRDEGVEFGKLITGLMYVYLAFGLVVDFLFNVVFGTIIFRERPRELTFTKRVKRNLTSTDRRRMTKARDWQMKLNKIMPGHV